MTVMRLLVMWLHELRRMKVIINKSNQNITTPNGMSKNV